MGQAGSWLGDPEPAWQRTWKIRKEEEVKVSRKGSTVSMLVGRK